MEEESRIYLPARSLFKICPKGIINTYRLHTHGLPVETLVSCFWDREATGLEKEMFSEDGELLFQGHAHEQHEEIVSGYHSEPVCLQKQGPLLSDSKASIWSWSAQMTLIYIRQLKELRVKGNRIENSQTNQIISLPLLNQPGLGCIKFLQISKALTNKLYMNISIRLQELCYCN